jgi:hypothetical protein
VLSSFALYVEMCGPSHTRRGWRAQVVTRACLEELCQFTLSEERLVVSKKGDKGTAVGEERPLTSSLLAAELPPNASSLLVRLM